MQSDRQQLRRYFTDAWHKRDSAPLSALERQLLTVMLQHPQYHTLLEHIESLDQDYDSAHNPFLHMSLHVGLLEQLTTNRPMGICTIYQKLIEKIGDTHRVEHMMMDVMGEIIWNAQQQQQPPDETEYVRQLQKLLEGV